MRAARLVVATALAAAFLGGCTPPVNVAERHLSLDEAKAVAAEKGLPVLLDFYSPT